MSTSWLTFDYVLVNSLCCSLCISLYWWDKLAWCLYCDRYYGTMCHQFLLWRNWDCNSDFAKYCCTYHRSWQVSLILLLLFCCCLIVSPNVITFCFLPPPLPSPSFLPPSSSSWSLYLLCLQWIEDTFYFYFFPLSTFFCDHIKLIFFCQVRYTKNYKNVMRDPSCITCLII